MSNPPERTRNHRIETKAVRLAQSQMSEDWLVRSLDERDYGIDLLVEFFGSHNYPTGVFAHVQSKGIEAGFNTLQDGTVKLSIPVKTVLYAQKSQAPFFVFHTSLLTKETMFLWLQKHIKHTLKPGWETQEDITIYFDSTHKLGSGNVILENMINNSNLEAEAVEGICLLNWLQSEFESAGKGNVDIAKRALQHLTQLHALDFVRNKIAEMPPFDSELRFATLAPILTNVCHGIPIRDNDKELLADGSAGARDFVQILLAWAEVLETDVAAYDS